jgi:hypothetical protein
LIAGDLVRPLRDDTAARVIDRWRRAVVRSPAADERSAGERGRENEGCAAYAAR